MAGKYGTVRDVLAGYLQLTIFINMIRLKSLLTEISFGNIKPYVEDIHWTLSGGGYDFMFTDEYDNEVIVNLADQTPFDSDEDDSELEESEFKEELSECNLNNYFN